MRLVFDIQMPDFEDLKSNAHRLAHKAAGTAVLDQFTKKHLDARFTGRKSRELQFKQRDPDYKVAKRKRGRGGEQDHNWSGESRRLAKQTRNRYQITPKKIGVKITVGPGYMKRRRLTGPDLRAEIVRFSDAEMKEAAEIYAETYAEFVNTNPAARKKTRRRIR